MNIEKYRYLFTFGKILQDHLVETYRVETYRIETYRVDITSPSVTYMSSYTGAMYVTVSTRWL